MKNIEHKNDDGKRYLKKYEIVETDVELPIQGQVRDPEDLYKFLKDLEDAYGRSSSRNFFDERGIRA